MKILFLCTAHNSLSQRLYLELTAAGHDVSIEYALSDRVMLEAVELFKPNIIICPFLTTKVPAAIYNNVMTLIVHPGVPGDAGPSAIDWVLMGDDGTIEDSNELLAELEKGNVRQGRSHWGITVLQAVEQLDAGPVWAWDQFPIDIDAPGLTKSSLYRGPITRAAVKAVRVAVHRIVKAISEACDKPSTTGFSLPAFHADPKYAQFSVTDNLPFQGGKTHHRPLLKAAQRVVDPSRHSSTQVSRAIRSADSQPGVLTSILGPRYYVYGGQVEHGTTKADPLQLKSVKILGLRHEAICIETADKKGVWITHLRRPKLGGGLLHPKVPALTALLEDGVLMACHLDALAWPANKDYSPSPFPTLEEITITFETDAHANKTAYLSFDFYNGATTTTQCSRLIAALDYILTHHTPSHPIRAVVLQGSANYFSNGIALNVIETSPDPAAESWRNINRIDDLVHYLLSTLPAQNILTIAAVRGNAAAGGVALAAACDLVIAGSEVVLNPAYRAIGLYGSEYHTLSYPGRCGAKKAAEILRSMRPMSPLSAQRVGLVDYVFPGSGAALDECIRAHVSLLLQPRCLTKGFWKSGKLDFSPAGLAVVREGELGEMARDFWSPRAQRYHARRFEFVRKVKGTRTPLRFAKHRRIRPDMLDEEETNAFDDVEAFRQRDEEEIKARVMKEMRAMMASLSSTTTTSTASNVSTAPTTPGEGEEMEGFNHKVEKVKAVPGDVGGEKGEKAEEKDVVETIFGCYYQPERQVGSAL